MPEVLAHACDDAAPQFHRTTITIPEPGPHDVCFDVTYAGICHSDIHTAREEWGPARFPLTPGHEIAGVVARVGEAVTRFKVGDKVGVGCMVDACGECEMCRADQEQFCTGTPGGLLGTLWTYGDDADGNPTAGGYAQGFTVSEDFACRIPEEIPFETAAPLPCAGITTYSPLKRFGAGPGKRVAVVGMGGLADRRHRRDAGNARLLRGARRPPAGRDHLRQGDHGRLRRRRRLQGAYRYVIDTSTF